MSALRRFFTSKAGVVGTVVGVTAAGIAAGVATERYLVRRSRRGEDPYADEPFGRLSYSTRLQVTTDDGLDLHVEVVEPDVPDAKAPTLVFVHGFCLDMGTFHFQREEFDGQYRMVLYDQPGHGRSGRLAKGQYTLENLGAALRAVLDRAAPTGRVVLIGHSMGGMAIMALAERWPELVRARVAGVAFISTSAGNLDKAAFGMPQAFARFRGALLPAVRTAAPVAAAVVDRARNATTDLAWLLTRKYGFASTRPSPAVVSYVERMNASTSLDVIGRYLQTLNEHDRTVALSALRDIPVLVVSGDHDLLIPLEHAKEICMALPDAELVVVENAGHVVLLEHPAQVNDALAKFFDKVAAR